MFADLAGNELVKRSLKRLIADGRVPNALLFTGRDAIGKRRFAIELARAFLCNETSDSEGCGKCPACTRAATFHEPDRERKDEFERVNFSEHGDVGMIVPYRRSILVAAIRDLEREAFFRPFEARARFFIIDDADRMNDSASNALLKTLEEPPASSHIVLITSRPDRLMRTIRSRCQTIRFAPVPTEAIEKQIAAQGHTSNSEITSRFADGSLGRAISLDTEFFLERREMMFGALEAAILKTDIGSLLQVAERMNDAKNKDVFDDSIDILESLIRDLWLVSINAAGSLVNIDQRSRLETLSAAIRPKEISAWLEEIETLRQNLDVNINRKLAADALFVTIAGCG